MQNGLQPLQHRCGIALLPPRSSLNPRLPAADRSKRLSHDQSLVRCGNPDTRELKAAAEPTRTAAGVFLAAALTIGNLTVTDTASAKPNPVKKSDPYEVHLLTGLILSTVWYVNHQNACTGSSKYHQLTRWKQPKVSSGELPEISSRGCQAPSRDS